MFWKSRRAVVTYADARGRRHAETTLAQIWRQSGKHLPGLRIEDVPDFPVRGFMLDISRGKVPARAALRTLVRQLAALKYNHLQLYMEHTFAFRAHSAVWRNASPLTAAEIRDLQRYCDRLGVELSANFNSFGHFERWLKHPKYQHLAECPAGFGHPIKGRVPHGTTLKPNAASLKFLDKLWAEYLPLFKSKRFNLGGDEPWELGQGWSKRHVRKHGRHRIYLEFLKKLHVQAKRYGKETLFWGDILLEAPELVREVPPEATALLWGYEADHPFAEQCARLAAAKRKFWVCPGTSAWNTFTGRTDNMLANIEHAARHGLANEAEGLLLTSWGDGGNHQPWPVMYPGIAYAAGWAWNAKGARREDLPRALDLVFGDEGGVGFGQILLELGRVENAVREPRPNRSRHQVLFFATRDELAREFETISLAELKKIARALERARKKLSVTVRKNKRDLTAQNELRLGADMAAWAVRRALLAGASDARGPKAKKARALAAELRVLIGRFEKTWLLRARPGGLREATARMRAVEQELRTPA
jgi:hypothetical protein